MIKHQKRINEFDVIRVIATLLVVLGHSDFLVSHGFNITAHISESLPAFTTEYATLRPWIYSFHMPLFMILSGALFFSSVKKYSVKSYIINRFKRLMIPFFVCGFLFAIPIKYLTGYFDNSSLLHSYVKSLILMTTPGHLWFLWVLFILEVVFCLLYKFKILQKFSLIILILSFIAFLFSGMTTKYFQIYRLLQYPVYFLLGYLFESYRLREKFFVYFKGIKKLPLVALALLITIIGVYYMPEKNYWFLQLYGFAQAIFGTAFIFMICSVITVPGLLENSLYKLLLKYNFSIYLYHEPLQFLLLFILMKAGLLIYFNDNTMYWFLLVMRFVFTIFISVIIGLLVRFCKEKIIQLLKKQKGGNE